MLPERAFQRRAFGGMTLEGGKGGGGAAAPSPDPNIGIAQLELAAISREYLDTWKTEVWPQLKLESERLTARADEQFALDRELQNLQIESAKEGMDRYKKYGYPLQEQIFAEAEKAGSAEDIERQSALALGDVRAATAREERDMELMQRSYGIDPTSGRYQGMRRATGIDTAAMEAAAANRARTAAESLGWAKKMDATALAQGQFSNQATSTGLALSAGGAALGAAGIPMSSTQAMGSSMQQGYGLPMQGWQSVGQIGVSKYNADVNAFSAQTQADAQRQSAFGSTLGALAGAGAYMYGGPAAGAAVSRSDIRTKQNIIAVGKLPNGLTVYEFEYKPEFKDEAGHGRYRGVMAHEVEQIIPEAVITTADGYKAVNYSMVI
jgi:hypothetical protein